MPESSALTAEIYWRPGCPYCSALRRDLDRRGVPTVWRDIWVDEQARAFVRSVNNDNETVPTVRVGSTTLTNPSGARVARLLAGDPSLPQPKPGGNGPPGSSTTPAGARAARQIASWLPTIGFIVAGLALARQDQGALSWGFGLLAVAAWWLTRPLREQDRP